MAAIFDSALDKWFYELDDSCKVFWSKYMRSLAKTEFI